MSTKKQNKFCCEIHMDMCIDDFLVENEVSPCIEKVQDEICSYCPENAIYVIKPFPQN